MKLKKRLRMIRRRLRGMYFDWKNRHHRDQEGWCMCGERVDEHGWGNGHTAVDSWHYYRDRYINGDK